MNQTDKTTTEAITDWEVLILSSAERQKNASLLELISKVLSVVLIKL